MKALPCAILLLAVAVVVVASTPFYRRRSSGRRHHHDAILPQKSDAVRRWYTRPPHDARLYDTLRVAPNATLAEIQKSWRRLSREWHPDKVAVRRRASMRRPQPPPPPPPPPIEGAGDDTTKRPPPPPPPLANEGDRNSPSSPTTRQHDIQQGTACDTIDEDEDSDHEEYARQKLAEIAMAYEILSDDHTRLLYHKYGLVGGTDAAIQLLAGRASSVTDEFDSNLQPGRETTEEQGRLLELMGYPPEGYTAAPSWSFPQHHLNGHNRHHSHRSAQHRLAYLTATITERLRPLVEGTVSQDLFVNEIYRECNALKKTVFGAQILRCVGRAYRIEGYRILRTMHRGGSAQQNGGRRGYERRHHAIVGRRKRHAHEEVTDRVFDGWRDVKQYASAALASGKLVLMEQRVKKLEEERERLQEQKKERRQQRQTAKREQIKMIQTRGGVDAAKAEAALFASGIGALPGEENSYDDDDQVIDDNIGGFSDDEDEDLLSDDDIVDGEGDELEQELQHEQHQKKYSALLTAHQMEALWKITKIELDRIIREACRQILSEPSTGAGDGWHAFCPPPDDYYHDQYPPPPPPPHSKQRHHHHHHRHSHRHHHRRSEWRPDGWVGTTGEVVSMEVGRLRAAAAMILVGDIMVRASKDGTAWNK